MDHDFAERAMYAFGHLVASHNADAHAADSGDLASEVMTELGLTDRERDLVELAAEYVAGNYTYHGEAELFTKRVKAGEA